MYLVDLITIALCKFFLALLASCPESSEKEQMSVDIEKVAPVVVDPPLPPTNPTPYDRPTASQKSRPPSSLGTLAALPPELRNKIYAHVLRAPETISIRRRRIWPRNTPWARRYDTRSVANSRPAKFTVEGAIEREGRRLSVEKALGSLGLLSVSRAVGAEAKGILLRRNRFVFKDEMALREFGRKLERSGWSLVDVPVKECEGGIVLGF